MSDAELANALALTVIKLPRVLRALDPTPMLTPTEASALAVLVYGGPMNIGTLAQLEQVKPPSITRTVTNLESRSLVTRKQDQNDARSWIVEASPSGIKLFIKGHERRLKPLVQWLNQLSQTDKEKLLQTLPVLVSMAELTPSPGS